MKPSRSQLVLSGICLVLAIAIIVIESLPAAPPAQAVPDGDIAPGNPSIVAPEPTADLTGLRTRPPFWPDRRAPIPVVVPAAVVPPPAPPPPPSPPDSALTLIGIVNGPEGRIAILRLKSSGKLERHIEGDAVDQWAIKRILVDRVVFLGGGSESDLLFPPPGERKSGQSPSLGSQHMPSQPIPLQSVPARR